MPPRRPKVALVQAGIGGGADITRGHVDGSMLLSPQDDLVGGRPPVSRYRAYRSLLQDDRVGASFRQRRSALIGRQWEVVPGGDGDIDGAAADYVREALQRLPWDRISDRMLYSVFYGLAVAEVVWMKDGRHYAPEKILVRDRGRFAFGGEGGDELRLITAGKPLGEPMAPEYFWTVAVGGDHDDEPYGLGLGWELYWPVFFKRQGATAWADFLDRFAKPIPWASYQREGDLDAVHEALESVREGRGAAVPAGVAMDLLKAGSTGTVDYDTWTGVWNRAVSTTLLGQTMTTEDGSSRSQAEVHMEVRQDIVQADDDVLADSLQGQVLRRMIEWAYPGAAVPRVKRVLDDPPDTQALSERDERIWRMGWTPTRAYIEDTYGIEVEAAPRASTPPAAPGESADFADEGPAARDFAEHAAERIDPLIADWIGRLRESLVGHGE